MLLVIFYWSFVIQPFSLFVFLVMVLVFHDFVLFLIHAKGVRYLQCIHISYPITQAQRVKPNVWPIPSSHCNYNNGLMMPGSASAQLCNRPLCGPCLVKYLYIHSAARHATACSIHVWLLRAVWLSSFKGPTALGTVFLVCLAQTFFEFGLHGFWFIHWETLRR